MSRKGFNIFGAIAAKQKKSLFTNPAKISLPETTEKPEHMLKVTRPVDTMYLLYQVKREMEVLDETMRSVAYIYRSKFRDLVELPEACAGKN